VADPNDPCVVLSTAPDLARAKALAHALVTRRLVACVNVLPGLTSIYRWQGAVEEASEVLLVMKTVAGRAGEIERAWKELHPYEVPELVVLPASHVEVKYLRWLIEESSAPRGE
jgi:periplasmic divalent cation tolerance protein